MNDAPIIADHVCPPIAAHSDRPSVVHQLFWASTLSLYFLAVYGLANGVTARRAAGGAVIPTFYFAWERKIPFIAPFIVPYMSIDLFFLAGPFVCTTIRELRTYIKRIVVATTIAGVFFVLMPLRLAFDRPQPNDLFGRVFEFLHRIDHPYNRAPSLHLAYCVILWMVYARHTRGGARWALGIWFLLIAVSPLFIAQHQLIDLIAGLALAWLCILIFAETRSPSPASPSRSHT